MNKTVREEFNKKLEEDVQEYMESFNTFRKEELINNAFEIGFIINLKKYLQKNDCLSEDEMKTIMKEGVLISLFKIYSEETPTLDLTDLYDALLEQKFQDTRMKGKTNK